MIGDEDEEVEKKGVVEEDEDVEVDDEKMRLRRIRRR